MRKFNIGDIVTLKIKPNSGQMYIHELLSKMFGGSDDNPMYTCKYFDEVKKEYLTERFLESVLELSNLQE